MRPIDADELRDIYSSVPNGVYTTGHIITAIDECETIDAVPLDKLCEWLKENALDITQRNVTPMKTSAEHWKRVLTKWMEGLDDDD